MAYITEEEINLYCNNPNVSMIDIENASYAIDSYKGKSFLPANYEEKVKLSRKLTRYGDSYKGKLRHMPRVEITEIYSYMPSYFGGTEEKVTYDTSCIRFDDEEYQYFEFIPQVNAHSIFVTKPPSEIFIKYSAGYSTIPEQIKRVCGIVADNIRLNGGFAKWSSKDDGYLKITLVQNEGILTREVKNMIDLVSLT